VAVAEPKHVARIYGESFSLWGGGLTYDGYVGLWEDLAATPWGRQHMQFLVLLDEHDAVLSSLKRYRTRFRLGERLVPGTVIGALFTPVRRRRRGHARALLEAALDLARSEDDVIALLFSDVGTGFYETCGFRALPATESFARIPSSAARLPSGWRVEPMGREHVDAAVEARAATAARSVLSLDRDRGLWDFLRTRTQTFFRRYGHADVRPRCVVAFDAGRLAGYVVSVEGHGEWSVREVGASDGTVATGAGVLRAAASVAVRNGCRRLHGWIPEAVASGVPEWTWRHRPRRRAVPMVAPVGNGVELDGVLATGSIDLTFLDQF